MHLVEWTSDTIILQYNRKEIHLRPIHIALIDRDQQRSLYRTQAV